MYKVIIIPIILLSTSVFSSSYYNNFYSDFHNSSRTFTDNSEMFEKDFLSPDELNLPWINALVRIPKNDGGVFRTSIRELDNNEKILKNKYKTIIYLHGCAGHWSGTAKRIDFFAKNGYAVIAPPSLARKKYAQSCDTAISRGGMYRKVLKIRQIDAEYAVLRARKLNWTDSDNIFLVGLSEGGITTATYNPENPKANVNARIVEGWTCNAGWPEYIGVNTPNNEPVLSMVAKYDPWFQLDILKGHCGQFINKNSLSKSIVIDKGALSKKHGLLHDTKMKKIALEFLKKVSK